MSFLQPLLLWGIAGAAIPVIIHLLNRRRFRTVKWAAMQFLLKATQESRGRKRLKHILILCCRALAIATLATAIARPLGGGLLGWGSGSVDTVVLLLDRSPSMERTEGAGERSKRVGVLERVAEAMAELDTARLVLIDSATGQAQEVPSPDTLPDLSSTAPTDSAADIPGLLLSGLEYLNEAKAGRSEIWLASDLQAPDWKSDDPRWDAFRATMESMTQKPTVRVLALDEREGQDKSIHLLGTRREGNEIIVETEVFRESDHAPETISITTSLLGTSITEEVDFEGQTLRHQTRHRIDDRIAGGHGWVSLQPDANPRNNAAFYAFGPDAPVYTWLVTDEALDPEAALALQRAAAPGAANQQVTTLPPSEALRIQWDSASLVIWQAPLPEGPAAEALLTYLQSGGVALFLPSGDSRPEASMAGLGWGPLEESSRDKFFIVKDWNRQDGPLRDGIDGAEIPMQRLRAIQRRAITGEATTLARWDDEAPLLVRQVVEGGTAYFLSTLPDYGWSNLEHTAVHLVVIQRALAEGSRRLGAGFQGTAGEASATARAGEVRVRIDDYPGSTSRADSPDLAGVFRMGDRTVAVNRPASEDDPMVLGEDLLREELLAGTNYSLFGEASAADTPFVREIWRAFLIAMLLFLIGEAILCLQPRKHNAPAAVTRQPTTPSS